jgi:radical SAM protein with 4Fe4S-binding SPASM domain
MAADSPWNREVACVSENMVSSMPLSKLGLWKRIEQKRTPTSFEMDVTARCNHNCRHCYINLPLEDEEAARKELSFDEIREIVDEAVSMGALWCLVTGGEPLVREDFPEIYLYLKKKGLLVSLFTNSTLITNEHVRLFNKYPLRDIEVTVYGATEETYERVTRRPGAFSAFIQGLDLLIRGGIRVRLKAMALRSNVQEFPDIVRFCQERTKDYFRFDPFLHLRYDRDPFRNKEIKGERLSPQEIVSLERSDQTRFEVLKRSCEYLNELKGVQQHEAPLFSCGAGINSFVLGYDGIFRLCSSLYHPDTLYDLKQGSLFHAWRVFVPQVRGMRSTGNSYVESCGKCHLVNLCMWCPANVYLETGNLDMPVAYFCELAHAREAALTKIHHPFG